MQATLVSELFTVKNFTYKMYTANLSVVKNTAISHVIMPAVL